MNVIQEINNAFEFPNRLNQFEEFFFKESKSEYLSSTRKTTWRSSYKPYLKRVLNIYYEKESEDLEKILFHVAEFPWNDNKYGKRLNRLCYLYFLVVFTDKNMNNKQRLNLLSTTMSV